MMLLGPVAAASKGGDSSLGWIGMLVASFVLVTAWIKYLKRSPDTKVPLVNVIWISGVCAVMIVASIWEMLHR